MKLYNHTDKSINVRASNSCSIVLQKQSLSNSFNPKVFNIPVLSRYLKDFKVLLETPYDRDYLRTNRLKYTEIEQSKVVKEPEKKVVIIKF